MTDHPDPQPAIFRVAGRAHWAAEFDVAPTADLSDLRRALAAMRDNVTSDLTIAFGPDLMRRLHPDAMPADHGPLLGRSGVTGSTMVAAQTDLFLWLCGNGVDAVMTDVLVIRNHLKHLVDLRVETNAFVYLESRDLSGFEDGTGNPDPEDAPAVALVADGPGAGGSHVLVQKWRHDLDGLLGLDDAEQEAVIGRTKLDSVELDPVPEDSHVGRMVVRDESGDEEEIWRRSVPWGGYDEHGLVFLAFAADPNRFEHMLDHMFAVGHGPEDRLLSFSTAVSGGRYFAPSVPDLEVALGLR